MRDLAFPLYDFACRADYRQVPYVFVSDSYRGGRPTKVMPVRSKTGLVATRRGSIAHLDTGVAAIVEDGRLRFGARFACGRGSHDVGILADAEAYGGVCDYCVDAVAGPGVYRCHSSSDALLYIGSAALVLERLKSHRSQTSWWPDVADVRITRYPTIFEARGAERLAIGAEQPLHNVAYKKPPASRGAA